MNIAPLDDRDDLLATLRLAASVLDGTYPLTICDGYYATYIGPEVLTTIRNAIEKAEGHQP